MTTIKSYAYNKVPKKIQSRLSVLHLANGMLWPTYTQMLEDPRECHADARVFVAFEEQRVVGWALRFKRSAGSSKYTTWVYVQSTHRRKGIGTAIIEAADRRFKPGLNVEPWDRRSTAFFATIKDPKNRISGRGNGW